MCHVPERLKDRQIRQYMSTCQRLGLPSLARAWSTTSSDSLLSAISHYTASLSQKKGGNSIVHGRETFVVMTCKCIVSLQHAGIQTTSRIC